MLNNLFFDWYSASVDASPNYLITMLKTVYKTVTLEPARPKYGYTHSDRALLPDGKTAFTLLYGGATQGTNTLVYSSGDNAHKFALTIRDLFPDHELTRADIAIDFDDGGAYLSLFQHGIRAARSVGVSNSFIGEAGTELSEHTVRGRTLYLGSRSSASMVRIYEKGKKDDKTRPDWVRAEMEIKPQNRDARYALAKASILEMVGSTRLGRAFYSALGDVPVSAIRPGTVRSKTDHDRAMDALRSQYHNTIAEELRRNGGDLLQLAVTLSTKAS